MKVAHTIAIERKNMKDLVIHMEVLHGDKIGVYCAARKLLNRASIDRTILKQESTCLLGKLTLTLCSEKILDVSLSPFRRVVNRKEGDQDNKTTRTYWLSKYESRQGEPASQDNQLCAGT
jgi:hypothetical protein